MSILPYDTIITTIMSRGNAREKKTAMGMRIITLKSTKRYLSTVAPPLLRVAIHRVKIRGTRRVVYSVSLQKTLRLSCLIFILKDDGTQSTLVLPDKECAREIDVLRQRQGVLLRYKDDSRMTVSLLKRIDSSPKHNLSPIEHKYLARPSNDLLKIVSHHENRL